MAEQTDFFSYVGAGAIFQPGRLVMDPAMLKLLREEKIRDIAVIALEAQVMAQQRIIEELKTMKF
jgi:hypothetical protein